MNLSNRLLYSRRFLVTKFNVCAENPFDPSTGVVLSPIKPKSTMVRPTRVILPIPEIDQGAGPAQIALDLDVEQASLILILKKDTADF